MSRRSRQFTPFRTHEQAHESHHTKIVSRAVFHSSSLGDENDGIAFFGKTQKKWVDVFMDNSPEADNHSTVNMKYSAVTTGGRRER